MFDVFVSMFFWRVSQLFVLAVDFIRLFHNNTCILVVLDDESMVILVALKRMEFSLSRKGKSYLVSFPGKNHLNLLVLVIFSGKPNQTSLKFNH